MNINELILENIKQINARLDQIDNKLETKFGSLKCSDQNLRIDRLEKKEEDREKHRSTFWAVACAAIGAFGLSVWNWFTRSQS